MANSVAVFTKFPTLISKLREILPIVQFIEIGPSDLTALKNAEIIIGDYPLIGPHLYDLPNAKWVQGTWSGIDSLWPHIKNNTSPPFPYTRISGENFALLMGEYVFTQIVNWERHYFKVRENQNQRLWDQGLDPYNCNYRSIADLKIGILGIGSIGNRIGRTLKYLGATIYGFGRRETVSLETEEYKHISRYYTSDTLPELLRSVDYIVSVLPHVQATNNVLGNEILKNCEGNNVVFINIGRGNIIKETELVDALREKWISGAILDVFETEPLPKESNLWDFPNVVITPHISGHSRVQDIAAKFKINWERFGNHQPLIDQIDYVKGY